MTQASISFTGTASAMEIFYKQGKIGRTPSVETCIQWELKFGLYKLMQPRAIANDWIWIVDHFTCKGHYKCFVVFGVRMSDVLWREDMTLHSEDVVTLGIVPMEVSNGNTVKIQLEQILRDSGGVPPLAIIGDHGSDLYCGCRHFLEVCPEVILVHDIIHKIALAYERLLFDDTAWTTFIQACASCRKRLLLTKSADLAPPNQRSKSRFHNIDVLVDWADKFLNEAKSVGRLPSELEWLKSFSEEVDYWKELVQIGRITRDMIRQHGLQHDSYMQLSNRLIYLQLCPRAHDFACMAIDMIEEETVKLEPGMCIIGSSEIIESMFGCYKHVIGKGPKKMGRLLLTIASRTGAAPTEALVKKAFETVKEKNVCDWIKSMFKKIDKNEIDISEHGHHTIISEEEAFTAAEDGMLLNTLLKHHKSRVRPPSQTSNNK